MKFFVKDIFDENFIKMIPALTAQIINEKSKGNKYKKMNDYLQKNYQITIEDVVKVLRYKGFSYSKVKNTYVVGVNYNTVESKTQLKLDTLVKLIDYGNREIRGIDLINSSMNYIIKNLLNIYRLYQMRMKGGQ